MKPVKISSIMTLLRIVKDLKAGKEKPIGSYLYKDYRIQISKYNLSTKERVSNLYKKRRLSGLCVQCGKKVKSVNPRTKKLYRLCDKHRKEIDLK
jgi:hypothetical protein